MTKIDVSNNNMFGYRDGRGMVEFAAALKANHVLTELNLASNDIRANDAQLLSEGLSGNGALSVLSLKDNRLLTAAAGKVLSGMVATSTALKELDVSSNIQKSCRTWQGDGPGFAQELAIGLKENGALSCEDGRRFCGEKDSAAVEQLMDQVRSGSLIMKQYKEKMPLCVTNQCKHCGCDRVDHKAGKGAMTSLNLSSNGIGGYYRNGYFIPTPEGSPLNVLHIAFCL
jgi:hypothetical protein